MLYEIAHIVKDNFGFLWDAIEWGNAEAFALMHHKAMKGLPELLEECSGRYSLKLASQEDIARMKSFFDAQPQEAFRFFQPHDFDEKGIRKVVVNKSFLTFLAMDGDEIVGYFFMRSFVNGKTFKGYMVGIDHRGMGVAGEMGIAMNRVAKELGLRMFKSISPENPASMAVTKKVNDIKIIKTLNNGDMLIECFEKADSQCVIGGGENLYLIELELVNWPVGLQVEPSMMAA